MPLALACVAITGAWSTRAAADPHRTSSLSWVDLPGAEGCGGTPAIARAIEERLGRRAIVSPVDAELSIEAYAEHSGRPALWHAYVQVRARDGALLGSRDLASAADDCSELRAAVVLVAALMIDPDAARPTPGSPAGGGVDLPRSPSPAPAPTPACPPAPEPPAPPPPRIVIRRVEVPVPAASPAGRWTLEPSASFALGFGVLPSTASGVRVALAVGLQRPWGFEAFGKAWANQSVPAQQGAQVRFSLADLGAVVCPLSVGSAGLPRLAGCAGAEVGFLETSSQGFVAPQSSLDPTLRLAASASLSFPVAQGVSVRLGGELGFAVVRSQFVYNDPTGTSKVVADEPLVTGQADLGLAISLH